MGGSKKEHLSPETLNVHIHEGANSRPPKVNWPCQGHSRISRLREQPLSKRGSPRAKVSMRWALIPKVLMRVYPSNGGGDGLH